ncbi:thioredoxin [Methanocella sp. CWC-04]|uniref:Thioredoxin n=1 Tax=Methanooceanicella nereidis TaxID=2052831 RepID=A0AAP2RFB1_9EURY|nr:thioredoxin fold domain-containing protein [Methanocella sp. CWC-04]MCD1296298.1 thioredoxin [Methanocella sp. CWC-04]
MMEQKIRWGSDFNKAMDEAKRSGKLLLLFFHSEMCSGCQMTIQKTLPEKKVMSHVEDRFVPQMYEVSEPEVQDLKKRFNIEWTPTFIIADDNGNEAYRWVGYLPQDEFRAQLTLGEGKLAFKEENFDKASKCFQKVIDMFSGTELVPEAMYYKGVALYKKSQDVSNLNRAHDELKSKFPDSSWTKKASVWKQ